MGVGAGRSGATAGLRPKAERRGAESFGSSARNRGHHGAHHHQRRRGRNGAGGSTSSCSSSSSSSIAERQGGEGVGERSGVLAEGGRRAARRRISPEGGVIEGQRGRGGRPGETRRRRRLSVGGSAATSRAQARGRRNHAAAAGWRWLSLARPGASAATTRFRFTHSVFLGLNCIARNQLNVEKYGLFHSGE